MRAGRIVLRADAEHGLLEAAATQGRGHGGGQGRGRLGAEEGAGGGVDAERGPVGALDDDADADRVEQGVEQVGQLAGPAVTSAGSWPSASPWTSGSVPGWPNPRVRA